MILLTRAPGNVSRYVVVELLGTGAAVSGLTRNPESVGLPDDVVRGDLFGPDTLDA